MLLRERAQRLRKTVQIARDQVQRLAQLKYAARVDGILAGRAPVHEVRRLFVFFGHERGEVPYERNRNISSTSSGLPQRGSIEKFGPALRGDRGGRRRRYDPEARLGARQRPLEFEHSLERGAISEQVVDGWRAEEGIEKIHAMSVITPGGQTKRFPRASDETRCLLGGNASLVEL